MARRQGWKLLTTAIIYYVIGRWKATFFYFFYVLFQVMYFYCVSTLEKFIVCINKLFINRKFLIEYLFLYITCIIDFPKKL